MIGDPQIKKFARACSQRVYVIGFFYPSCRMVRPRAFQVSAAHSRQFGIRAKVAKRQKTKYVGLA